METGYFDNNRCPAAKDSHVLSIHSQHVNMVQRIPRQQNLFNFGLVKLETCQLCCEFITSLPTCGELANFLAFCNRSCYGMATISICPIVAQRMVIRWASFFLRSFLGRIRMDPPILGSTESPPIADIATQHGTVGSCDASPTLPPTGRPQGQPIETAKLFVTSQHLILLAHWNRVTTAAISQ